MAIYLPSSAEEEQLALDELTPREIVTELDKYVIGQTDAKRSVAIALRNRMRRQKLSPELAEEIIPKNIIMIGPTGVGKTEIARRLAKLANSPFMKVEASKFTEVGYVGRDVESMIRDLVEIAIDMVRQEKLEDVAEKAELNAEERLLDLLLPPAVPPPGSTTTEAAGYLHAGDGGSESYSRTREKLRQQLREGKLDERMVELDVREKSFPAFEIISNQGVEEMDVNIKDMLPTDHILSIAAGAFHVSKPSDLIPELQGRFPIRVELKSLTMEDFIRILTEPKSSLVKQYTALLETEGLKLEFTREALDEIAHFAFQVNESTENIGARRLHTIMERVLDEISFNAPDLTEKTVNVDAAYVQKMLADIVKDQDLSRYIL